MPCFDLRPDFITVLFHNNLTKLQLFVIILNCVRMSERPQQAPHVNAVLFHMKLITSPLWSIYKMDVISMQTAITGLICLRQFESAVLAVFMPKTSLIVDELIVHFTLGVKLI